MGEVNTVTVGKVLKPRGLKGEVKIQILTNKTDVFMTSASLVLGDRMYRLSKGSVQGGFAYCVFEGVGSVEAAEQLRGLSVKVEREQLNLTADEILATDIIGFAVKDSDGNSYGLVKDIENYGGGDIVITDSHSFPYEDEFVAETNMTKRTITIRADMLIEEEV